MVGKPNPRNGFVRAKRSPGSAGIHQETIPYRFGLSKCSDFGAFGKCGAVAPQFIFQNCVNRWTKFHRFFFASQSTERLKSTEISPDRATAHQSRDRNQPQPISARGRGRPCAPIVARWRPCCRSTIPTASPPISRPAAINRRQVAPSGRSLLRPRPSRLSALVAAPVRPAAPALAAALPAASQQTTTYLPLTPFALSAPPPRAPLRKRGRGAGRCVRSGRKQRSTVADRHFYYSLRLVREWSARGVGSPPAPVRRPLPTWGGDKRNARAARKITLYGWCWCASRSGPARLGLPRLAACAVSKAQRRTFARGRPTLRGGDGPLGLAWLPIAAFVWPFGQAWPLAFRVGRRPRPLRKRGGARLPPPRRSIKAAEPARKAILSTLSPCGRGCQASPRGPSPPLCRPMGRWAAAVPRLIGGSLRGALPRR